jgi:hypothetical protein
MRKTFKIGEEAVGGIMAVETAPRNVFIVKCLDSVSKEPITWRYVYDYSGLETHLMEITTSFYAERIVTYFKTKSKL